MEKGNRILFSENIKLDKNSFVVGGMMGGNWAGERRGYIHHALVETMDDRTKLLCNSKATPIVIVDQGVYEGEIDCKRCLARIEKLKSSLGGILK
ncbi:MAG: hypothetical protein AAF391_13755 [Bacteroidota bacterium]